MGLLEDIMKTLDRIPAWKRMQALPSQVDALEARVRALEAKQLPGTGQRCPSCGVNTYKLLKSGPMPGPFGELGARVDYFGCSSCSYTDEKHRDPGQ